MKKKKIVNAVDTYYVGLADPFALATQSAPINVSSRYTSRQPFLTHDHGTTRCKGYLLGHKIGKVPKIVCM